MYGNRTHYVTNQKLTLEMLKQISDSKDVLEVIGEYTGDIGGWGPSHEQHSGHNTHMITIHPPLPNSSRPRNNSNNHRRLKKAGRIILLTNILLTLISDMAIVVLCIIVLSNKCS